MIRLCINRSATCGGTAQGYICICLLEPSSLHTFRYAYVALVLTSLPFFVVFLLVSYPGIIFPWCSVGYSQSSHHEQGHAAEPLVEMCSRHNQWDHRNSLWRVRAIVALQGAKQYRQLLLCYFWIVQRPSILEPLEYFKKAYIYAVWNSIYAVWKAHELCSKHIYIYISLSKAFTNILVIWL